MQPNENENAQGSLVFFFFFWFLLGWFLSVPNVFPSSFQCVPQDVLNTA
jgi:hypothetical protein